MTTSNGTATEIRSATLSARTTRRSFLSVGGLLAVGLGGLPAFARRALAEAPSPSRPRVLVTLFQRGAVDGLSMVPPVGDPRYAALRPTIAIPSRGDGAALPLENGFGLHPALSALKPLWDGGSLAVVHAVGSPDPTRSHFDAQDALDLGTPGARSTPDGWLNRALQAAPPQASGSARGPALRAVGFSPTMPRSLSGAAPALALSSLADFTVKAGSSSEALASGFESMYAGAVDQALRTTGEEAFDSMRALREASPSRIPVRDGVTYPTSPLGRRMKEIAQLVKADLGLEVAATDCGGWDTHANQGSAAGQLANRLRDLGDSLAAFAADLGDRMADVCVVTMTEFGRTVRENGTRGTDHGHGSVMFAFGGPVRGRRVLGEWKGLSDDVLFEGRDLPATSDHRDVLSELLAGHLGVKDLAKVFPGYTPRRLGLV